MSTKSDRQLPGADRADEQASPASIEQLVRFDQAGLVCCIVQDWNSGQLLMVAYMNAEALRRTTESGQLHLYSRSRAEQWHKGATSGNFQHVRALRIDCDGDAVLVLVEPAGPACHTGERSCFHRGTLEPAAPFEVLPALEQTLIERASSRPEGSYTAALLADTALIAEKVLEEAEEVTRAAREETAQRVDEEAADVIYHLMVLLRSRERSLTDVQRILDGRRR